MVEGGLTAQATEDAVAERSASDAIPAEKLSALGATAGAIRVGDPPVFLVGLHGDLQSTKPGSRDEEGIEGYWRFVRTERQLSKRRAAQNALASLRGVAAIDAGTAWTTSVDLGHASPLLHH